MQPVEPKSEDNYWPYYITLENFEGCEINFNSGITLKKLHNDKDFKTRFVAHIVTEIKNFIIIHKEGLLSFLDNNK